MSRTTAFAYREWIDHAQCRNVGDLSLLESAYFGALRLGLKTVGQLSDGVRLGFETGFDSGQSLEYAYANRPGGRFGVGRWIDRAYLNRRGLRALRRRRVHLQAFLETAIRERLATHGRAHVRDLAAGTGHIVLDVLASLPDPGHVTATLCDVDPTCVRHAADAAAARKLSDRVACVSGDAYSSCPGVSDGPAADIAVVSGLYEWCDDDERVARSLETLAERAAPDATLLYTGMPRHPDRRKIAATLPGRGGRRLALADRPQTRLDALVRRAGFEPGETRADRWRIFTVTRAKKNPGAGRG